MKNKGVFILLLLLFLLSLSGGVLGYIASKNPKNDSLEIPQRVGKISLIYYIDDVEVDELPVNTPAVDELGNEIYKSDYTFSSLSCTNGIEAKFDVETWEFKTDTEKDATCKLYFLKNEYEVTLEVTNAQLGADNDFFVERESDGVFSVIPADGHEFEKATCSDGKNIVWDEEDKTLTINSITKDVACTVIFKTKKLTYEITAKNGTANPTSEEILYGEKVSAIVTPNDGYEEDKVECTNSQVPVFKDNKLIIEKITDNTKCTVTFKKKIEEFTLSLNLPTNNLKLIQGSPLQTILKGENGSFTVKPDEGYEISYENCGNTIPSKVLNEDGSTTYTFNSVSSNIVCTMEVKVIETESIPQDQ